MITGTASRAYDSDFRISELSVNGDNPIGFSYDADSLLVWAGDEALTRHPEHGLITETTLGVVTDTWDYNSFGELASYSASQNGAPLFATTFTRDKLGRIETKTETVDAATDIYAYHYDLAGRLESIDQNSVEIARYTYDPNGNRETYLGQLGEVTDAETTYDAQDRLISYGNLTYTYTANGELQTKTAGSALTSYQYDVFGNLRAVELPDGTDVEYVIDGRNRRVGKKVNGTLVQGFLYQDLLEPIAELDGSGSVVARFVYGSRAHVPDYMVKGGTTYRIISDHLGSPRLVVDSGSGAVVQRLAYDEFGNVLEDTNPGFQPFGFAGGIYERDAKLVRFGARDYDVETGRWTAKDPILFAGRDTNLYGYVLNDPVNLVDPAGEIPPLLGAILAIGATHIIAYGTAYGSAWLASALANYFSEADTDQCIVDPREIDLALRIAALMASLGLGQAAAAIALPDLLAAGLANPSFVLDAMQGYPNSTAPPPTVGGLVGYGVSQLPN